MAIHDRKRRAFQGDPKSFAYIEGEVTLQGGVGTPPPEGSVKADVQHRPGGPTETRQVRLLADQTIRWKLQSGVYPYRDTYRVTPAGEESLRGMAANGPVSLVISCNGTVMKAENLWIVEFPTSDHPHIGAVMLADRRFWWSYSHIRRLFNIRRRVGTKRIQTEAVAALDPVVDRVWYIPASLKPPTPRGRTWKADEILTDILTEDDGVLVREMDRKGGKQARLELGAIKKRTNLPIVDLRLDERGDAAIQRVLTYIPGAEITVDLDGEVRIYDRLKDINKPDAGLSTMEKLGPEIVGGGHHEYITNEWTRPERINVYFTCEAEVRFDFKENTGADTSENPDRTTVVGEPNNDKMGDKRLCDNVLPVPDFSLKDVTDRGVTQDEVCMGTWVNVDAALNAWNDTAANGDFPPDAKVKGKFKLDHEFIQMSYTPYLDLWTGFALIGDAVTNADWMGRIAAIQSNYRRTFRLNARWMDKIESLRAYRVAIVDQANGTRAPALCFTDYSIKGTQRSFFKNRHKSNLYAVVLNGLDPDEKITKDTRPASADVRVVDEDQGIIQCQFVVDPFKVYDTIVPGIMTPNVLGNYNVMDEEFVFKSGHSPLANAARRYGGSNIAKLSPEHRASFIISAVPATPNNINQLYKVEVTRAEVRQKMRGDIVRGLDKALGPPMDLRIGPGVEVARIRWDDDRSEEIEALFGQVDRKPNLDDLIMNLDSPTGGGSLKDIAISVAASRYAEMVDRWEGNATGFINPDIEVGGFMDSIMFSLSPSGEGLTALSMPQQAPSVPFEMFLGASTRALLQRLPQA